MACCRSARPSAGKFHIRHGFFEAGGWKRQRGFLGRAAISKGSSRTGAQAQGQKLLVKSWMERGNEYATKTAIRAEYAEKERELQERDDLSPKGKKQLQAFLRMEQIAAEPRADGAEIGEIKRRIDGKGIVTFTLESSGTIRDTGKEIFFSSYDAKAQRIACKRSRGKPAEIIEETHVGGDDATFAF